jgi:hypothetical protein
VVVAQRLCGGVDDDRALDARLVDGVGAPGGDVREERRGEEKEKEEREGREGITLNAQR